MPQPGYTSHKYISLYVVSQFSSVAQSYPTICNPMGCSTPGFPVHHELPELTQAHVHWVGDAIQPAHPLSFPSHPTFNLSQLKVFSNESVLPIRWLKYWSFSFSVSPSNEYSGVITLGWTGWIYLLSKGPLRVFSNTTVKNHQFFGTQLSLWMCPTLTSIHDYCKNHSFD